MITSIAELKDLIKFCQSNGVTSIAIDKIAFTITPQVEMFPEVEQPLFRDENPRKLPKEKFLDPLTFSRE